MGRGKSSHLITCLFPLTLPRLHYFNATPNVCSVAACLFQQRDHCLAIHRVCFILVVAFRTTVKETAMELVYSARLCAPPVDRSVSYPLLAVINLMTDCASVLSRFPCEPLDSHLPERLCLLWTELLFLSTTRVPSRASAPTGIQRCHRTIQSIYTSLRLIFW